MDYLYLFIGAAIVISCFYFIVAPFFTSEEIPVAYGEGDDNKLSLEMIYETVNELEMDYLMKKISKEDFESTKKRYQVLAASFLKEESDMKTTHLKKQPIGDEIEQEILRELGELRQQQGRME